MLQKILHLLSLSCWIVSFHSSLWAVDLGKSNNPSKPPSPYAEVPKLTLSGLAVLRKPADELQMKIGVVTLSDKAETALIENSARMQSVMRNLQSAGLSSTEYETGHFAIHPTYTPFPKEPSPEWKPSINGYEVSNSIIIRTSRLEDAGKLIDAANRAGANSIDSISFVLKDPQTYWSEAINEATANALADAKSLAEAAGVRLVRLLSITLENRHVVTPTDNTISARAMTTETIPPIEPGDVSISAHVSVVYEITP